MEFWKNIFNKNGILVRDETACTLCGLCGARCPHKALKVKKEKHVWKIRGLCMGCGRCVRECPEHALSFQPKRPVS